MNPIVETIFGPESKLCTCGLEIRHQELSKRATDEDTKDGEKELFEIIMREIGL